MAESPRNLVGPLLIIGVYLLLQCVYILSPSQDSILSDGGEGESSEPESAAVCSVPIS